MPIVICNTDQRAWVVVDSTLDAKPVRQMGKSWIQDGDFSPLKLVDDGGHTWTYEWACGDHVARLEVPAYDMLDCTWQAGSSGVCSTLALQRVQQKPSDFYTNPSYGMACPCCGHQGMHVVYRDPQYARPICIQENR